MNDELEYLRWFHKNYYRFLRTDHNKLRVLVDLTSCHAAYEAESGQKAPAVQDSIYE